MEIKVLPVTILPEGGLPGLERVTDFTVSLLYMAKCAMEYDCFFEISEDDEMFGFNPEQMFREMTYLVSKKIFQPVYNKDGLSRIRRSRSWSCRSSRGGCSASG